MKHRPKSQLTSAALGASLFIVLIQLYLFETVLGLVLEGNRRPLLIAFTISALLSLAALALAFLAPTLDKEP